MSITIRSFQVLKVPAVQLLKPSNPVTFPLSQQTKQNIAYLKTCFKKSFNTTITLGISAPQVGINQRFFIIPRDFSFMKYTNSPALMRSKIRVLQVVINPIIKNLDQQKNIAKESCLSVQDDYDIQRGNNIEVQYQNIDGKVIKFQANGMISRIFQHQMDHLNGITIDKIGIKRYNKQTEQNTIDNKSQSKKLIEKQFIKTQL